jgi:hypothetical protein
VRVLSSTPAASLAALLVLPLVLLTGCEALNELIASVSDGASCESGDQCLGGACLTAQEGFPDGYCTTFDCDTQGCSNIFGSECLLLNQLRNQAACYVSCDGDGDCRDGYRCIDADGAQVCLPNGLAAGLPQAGETGTSCSRDLDCDGGTCLTNFTGGYCTALGCNSDSDCASFGEGRCLTLSADGVDTFTACFDGCSSDAECRFGYGCTDPDGSGGVCEVLDESNPVRNPNGANDGQPCLVDINCKGGTCLREEEGYPDGYCTTLSCNRIGCNLPNAVCRTFESDSACFVGCAENSDCREGYVCQGDGYCGPPVSVSPLPSDPTDPNATLEIVCDSEPISGGRRLTFQIDAATTSFAVVPFSNSSSVRPTALRLPNGTVGANFDSNYAFFDINWQILGNISPVFFPAAPQFRSITQQGGGMYSLDVETGDSRPCYYVLEKAGEGSRIRINLYFVGVPGISAQSARNDRDVAEMLDAFEAMYNNAGITLEQVNYFGLADVVGPGEDAAALEQRFSLIRSFSDISELIALSEAPGPTLGEALSVNIFLINDFAIPEAPGLLGLSAGIPGVPGLHGNHGAGLVFTSAPLGVDNASLGQTMAHEVGHFNGLRHTTEHGGGGDPLQDTPQCNNPNNGTSCPDVRNFMFPFSIGGVNQTQVSAEQSQVLRWAPLIQ